MIKHIAAIALTASLVGTSAIAAEITEFRIGILGGENAQDRLNSFECLREKTEELLGVETRVFAPADYNGVVEGLLGGTLDMAWLGASSYAKLYLSNPEAVEPVLIKVNTNGSFGYFSIAFARKDKGISSLADMRGRTFGFGDPNSTSGYLIPSIEIPKLINATMDSGDYFGDVSFTGGHEQTVVAVASGEIDAGVVPTDGFGNWEDGFHAGPLYKAQNAGMIDMSDLVEIWRSSVIPEGPVVLQKSLPERVKIDMTGLMASLRSIDPDCAYGVFSGEGKGMMPVDHSAYEVIIEARKHLSE